MNDDRRNLPSEHVETLAAPAFYFAGLRDVYGLHVQLPLTPAPEDPGDPGDPGGQEVLRAGVLDLDEKLEIEDDNVD